MVFGAGNISSPEFGLRYQEKKYLFRKMKRNKYYRNKKPRLLSLSVSPLKREMTGSKALQPTCLAIFMLAKAAYVCHIVKNLFGLCLRLPAQSF